MEFKKVNKVFRVVGIKGNGAFENFATKVPISAQQFLVRLDEIENNSNTEIAVFEPKKDEHHLEGHYYVGIMVDQALLDIPIDMEYIELNQNYVTARGNISKIGSLHSHLLNWANNNGYKRDLDSYIVETYHPLENGEEEVEIYLPIHANLES